MLPRPTFWQKARSLPPARRPARDAGAGAAFELFPVEKFDHDHAVDRIRSDPVIKQANAILDEICLDRNGAERLVRSRMPRRSSLTPSRSPRAMRP
jgi:hypothetical protein